MTDDRFDVFLCSADDALEKALRTGGMRVFRDRAFDDFDTGTAAALAGSRVLLAQCPRDPPTAFAARLTAAFTAALRHGDPADRVLTIGGQSPVKPLCRGSAALPDLVRRVRRKVAGTRGPLGPAPRPPHWFTGRHTAFWTVHNGLDGGRLLLHGLPGVGKTALAERYACLYRDSFGGGVLRTGPFGHLDPGDFLPAFHLDLARAVAEHWATDVTGLDLRRLSLLLADRITAAGEQVLLLVDDVPAGLPSTVLDRVAPGSARTLVTSRFAQSWAAPSVHLPGLTPEESAGLLPPGGDAVRRFALRCDGHPMTVRATAFAVRDAAGPLTDAVLAERPDLAPEAIRDVLRGLAPTARDLLRLGAVLAPAPLPQDVARAALGSPDPAEFEAAVAELAGHGFAQRSGELLRLQGLAVEVAQGESGALLGEAPDAVLAGLAREAPGSGLVRHARSLADHAPAHRLRLLRPVAAAHERHGDPAAAGEIHATILASGEATSADFAAAARVEIDCGLHAEAAEHAREALVLATTDAERHTASLTAAQALDCRGDYAEADVFRHAEHPPETGEARYRAALATAVAQRLRGRPQPALLEPLLDELEPGTLKDELALEHARSLLRAGHPQRASDVAAAVVANQHAAGRERHPRCEDAEFVRAEAVLTLDLAGLPADREDRAAELRALEQGYRLRYGAEHALTLTAATFADRALLALGRPRHALAALAATEQVVLRVLGDDHPLGYRIRHGRGLAHALLREFDRQAELVEAVLGPQIRLLGRTHPETLESRLDLGLALALSGRGPLEEARALVDDAARDTAGALGVSGELTAKARAAKQVVRLPASFTSALFAVERLVWPGA
ncbi:hypothetical protein M8542_22905 [Amycolatopsis sp. OK19-0408]|uniref:Uncharacterized protein n=1 Tax=Amycolatopsis iheyensis TaxID=2945988 RepID=A0A9X2SL04_9PSEU|nr:hypothetical protein [Amycolatopsis iheyensis]MCR6485678.1 hypothetical protein [Amycolatopsis iheyensis]